MSFPLAFTVGRRDGHLHDQLTRLVPFDLQHPMATVKKEVDRLLLFCFEGQSNSDSIIIRFFLLNYTEVDLTFKTKRCLSSSLNYLGWD
ncbi:hypothetical protein NPIL_68521 [Nephila pilipes]|uniref:Uncharacterized protein n=1 Tax=Nephila pilipes TaxID=299642 RepID=A0A8X6MWI0_NEPPI|nr:hypothetical protein NPIL_68521 [Nephila pilipes]